MAKSVLILEWKAHARNDLFAIVDYIAEDNPTAAQRLLTELESKANDLQEHPKLYRPGRVAGTREMIIAKNYVVVYASARRQSPFCGFSMRRSSGHRLVSRQRLWADLM